MYQEIEIEMFVKGGVVVKNTININNINSYRAFVENTAEVGNSKSDKLCTMVYFQGSVKATKVNLSYDILKKKIEEAQKNI